MATRERPVAKTGRRPSVPSLNNSLRNPALEEIKKRSMSVSSFTRLLEEYKRPAVEKWLYGITSNPKLDTIEVVLRELRIRLECDVAR